MEPAGIVLIALIAVGTLFVIGLFWVLALGIMTARAALEYFDRENARARQHDPRQSITRPSAPAAPPRPS